MPRAKLVELDRRRWSSGSAWAILILQGALFTDDFETGDRRRWSAVAP